MKFEDQVKKAMNQLAKDNQFHYLYQVLEEVAFEEPIKKSNNQVENLHIEKEKMLQSHAQCALYPQFKNHPKADELLTGSILDKIDISKLRQWHERWKQQPQYPGPFNMELVTAMLHQELSSIMLGGLN